MRTTPTPDEQRILDLLLPALDTAVPLWIDELSTTDDWQRVAMARECAERIAACGDVLMFRSPKKGETARTFNALAHGLAVLAYAPGGVTVFGRHWCTDHDVCTGARKAPEPATPRPPSVLDVWLPGDEPGAA